MVQCAMHAAAKQGKTTAVNKEGVLGFCRIFGLESFTDKPLSPETRKKKEKKNAKKEKLASCHSICFCNNLYVLFCELRNAWADGMFT